MLKACQDTLPRKKSTVEKYSRTDSVIKQYPKVDKDFFIKRPCNDLQPVPKSSKVLSPKTAAGLQRKKNSLAPMPQGPFFKNLIYRTPNKAEQVTMASTMHSGLTEKNIKANEQAKRILQAGNFRIDTRPRGKSIHKLRMDPIHYRGPNIGDCLYHTMQSFNKSRRDVSP